MSQKYLLITHMCQAQQTVIERVYLPGPANLYPDPAVCQDQETFIEYMLVTEDTVENITDLVSSWKGLGFL